MKILVITELYPAYNGHSVKEISYAIHYVIRELAKSNAIVVIRPIFITRRSRPFKFPIHTMLDNVNIYNIPVLRIPKTKLVCSWTIRLFLIIKQFNPDVIDAEMLSSYSIAKNIAKSFGSKLIISIHQSDLNNIYKIDSKIFFSSFRICCRSWQIKNKLIDVMPSLNNKLFVGYFGIDNHEIDSEDEILSKIEKWKGKRRISFVSVSLLQKLKNIDINIKALSMITDIDYEYIIIGDGEEKDNIQEMINRLHLESKIKLLGMMDRNDVLISLRNTDIFLMVSAPETYGLAYIEAMAKGNVVFCSKGWGIDGALVDGVNGYTVEPRDEFGLAEKINRFLKLPFSKKKNVLLNSYLTAKKLTNQQAAIDFMEEIR
jgi:glycosyltransferase involved in cell wall biosynthesis